MFQQHTWWGDNLPAGEHHGLFLPSSNKKLDCYVVSVNRVITQESII